MPPKQPKLSLKSRALRYLSLREHSRLELSRKLTRYAEPGEDVDEVLDFLEKNRFLSEQRFSEALVRRRAVNFGTSRIMAELRTHQLDPTLLAQSKAELADTELARARAVWLKKFGAMSGMARSGAATFAEPADLPLESPVHVDEDSQRDVDRQAAFDAAKLARAHKAQQIRYLAQRGFSAGVIRQVVGGGWDDDADLMEMVD